MVKTAGANHENDRRLVESLQLLFEKESMAELNEMATDSFPSDHSSPAVARLLLACHKGDWSAVERLARAILDDTNLSLVVKTFALHYAVAASEIEYQPEKRNQWMTDWHHLSGWVALPWCRAIREQQEGLSCFFRGDLKDAESRFRQCLQTARSTEYRYAEAQALFHLGLIDTELGRMNAALEKFAEALEITTRIQALRLRRRIAREMEPKALALATPSLEQVETLLASGKLRQAKKLVLHFCRIRRVEKRTWRSGSEYIYLGLVRAAQKQRRSVHLILQYTTDPIMRAKFYSMIDGLVGLSDSERAELNWLYDHLGVPMVNTNDSVLGFNIEQTAIISDEISEDVAILIRLMTSSPEGVTKEQICKSVWNLDYDPVIHDPKVYKLIMRSREALGRKDWLLNQYGRYKLNKNARRLA